MAPQALPDGRRVLLALDARRYDPPREPVEARYLSDGSSGLLHLPDRSRSRTSADLVLTRGQPVELAAGTLPDGRPVRLRIRVDDASREAE